MAIRRSSAREIQALVADLEHDSAVRREAAVARLSVLGTRAVERLVTAVSGHGSARARSVALRALEGIGDDRALAPALACLGDPDTGVVIAAIGVARALLRREHGTAAFDGLAALALDPARADEVRLAALFALAETKSQSLKPLWQQLEADPSPALRGAASSTPRSVTDPAAALDAAAVGSLPLDPEDLRALVAAAGPTAPLATLHRLVEAVRARETEEPAAEPQAEWRVVRGALHQILASRQSRVALYDLRETLEATDGPLPVEFVAALTAIGDTSCLEAIGGAYARAAAAGQPSHDWWRQHLASAFKAIVEREHLGARHAVVKRVRARWPDVAPDLVGQARRTG